MGPSICTQTARLRAMAAAASRSAWSRLATVVHAINIRNSLAGQSLAQVGNSVLTGFRAIVALAGFHPNRRPHMRDDYIKDALKSINDPNVLINVVSRRVKQLKRGNRPLVESLEKLSAEDTALREIIEGKISFDLAN